MMTIYRKFIDFVQIIRCLIVSKYRNTYLIRGKVKTNIKGDVLNINFGDDFNIDFVKLLTNNNVCYLPSNRLSYIFDKSYLVIGSTISFYSLKNVIIWGAGIRSEKDALKIINKPLEVKAVRGPKTRKLLLDNGIECPEVYGDPALLLPLFYKPTVKKKYKLGIIPSYTNINDINIIRLLKEDNTVLINVREYDNYKKFVDMINECEYIASSSLHGLKVSEAYGIPNVWVRFENITKGLDFKYYDYYESIRKCKEKPMMVTNSTLIDDIINKGREWKQGDIDVKPLIDSCPFELKKNIFDKVN